jgi:hypothetical protein
VPKDADELHVLNQLETTMPSYEIYERLVEGTRVVRSSMLSNTPLIDTKRHPVGLVISTHG